MDDPLGWSDNLRMGVYGDKGPPVVVLHGGPGAYGSAAPVAEALGCGFRVLEPWQRESGQRPLSVSVHVSDLHHLITSRFANERPALVGMSWGAMLALAYASHYPGAAGPLVLVGCGSFDENSRKKAGQIRQERISRFIARCPAHKSDLKLSLEAQIMKWHEMTDNYACEVDESGQADSGSFDMRGYQETWTDMLQCQKQGIYPKAFTTIAAPVIMLHGVYDPHPGQMIRDHLKLYIPHLEFRAFEQCGHSPYREKYAKDEFFQVMRQWLKEKYCGGSSPQWEDSFE